MRFFALILFGICGLSSSASQPRSAELHGHAAGLTIQQGSVESPIAQLGRMRDGLIITRNTIIENIKKGLRASENLDDLISRMNDVQKSYIMKEFGLTDAEATAFMTTLQQPAK
jgi:hypothetical protein